MNDLGVKLLEGDFDSGSFIVRMRLTPVNKAEYPVLFIYSGQFVDRVPNGPRGEWELHCGKFPVVNVRASLGLDVLMRRTAPDLESELERLRKRVENGEIPVGAPA